MTGVQVSGDPEAGATIDIDGIRTNYHDAGEGKAVVLLHGSGPGVSAWANWRGVIPGLARHHRVLAPDLLGFGYTAGTADGRYGPERWLRHLTGFLDALDLERISLVGNSFGGALALRLAVDQPQRVDRMVLMGSVGVPFELSTGLDQVWGFTPSAENMRRVLDLFAHDRSRVTEELTRVRLAAAVRPGAQEAFAAMFPPPRQRALDALVVEEEKIARLPQPALIVHGRDDRVIPLGTSLRLHELIVRSQLHVFGECGHWVQIEQRDRFLDLVSRFLAEPDLTAA